MRCWSWWGRPAWARAGWYEQGARRRRGIRQFTVRGRAGWHRQPLSSVPRSDAGRSSGSSGPTRRRWRLGSAGGVEPASAPELVPMLPLLGTVVHVDMPMTPEVEAIDPQFLPDQTGADAVIGLLDRLLGDAAALVVEDAQWTDGASDALLARHRRHRRRDGRDGRWSSSGATSRRWVRSRRTAARARPAARTAPLRELLTEPDHGAAAPRRGRAHAHPRRRQPLGARRAGAPGPGAGRLDDLPDSLEALVAAEIDVLSPLPRLLLGYASVLGRSFNPFVWRRILSR